MPGSEVLRHLFATMIGAAAMSHGAMAAPAPKPPAFAMCGACHKVDQGAPHGLGPNLWAIGGKVSGTTPGFKYSPALTKAKIKRSEEHTSELQSLMRISYAVIRLKKKT